MSQMEWIAVDIFCTRHHIDSSFLVSLHEMGLVEIITIEEKKFVAASSLYDLEKYARLHHDLDINAEGLHAIALLLEKLGMMQHELTSLRNRLRIYED
jgi:chaperone modulatory protein CbpM